MGFSWGNEGGYIVESLPIFFYNLDVNNLRSLVG